MNFLNSKLVELPSSAKLFMGVLSISIGVFANFAYQYIFVEDQRNIVKVTEIITHTPFFPQFLTMTKDLGEFTISYEKEVTIKDTGSFKIKFVPPIFSGLDESEILPLKISLSGTDIDVAPEKSHTFSPNEVVSEFTEWEWSFRPKSTGPNKLVLTTENIPYEKWYQPSVNRKEGYELVNPMFLDVYVNELSGLSPKNEFYIKTIGTIIAFILMYPLLITFFSRRFGWDSN